VAAELSTMHYHRGRRSTRWVNTLMISILSSKNCTNPPRILHTECDT